MTEAYTGLANLTNKLFGAVGMSISVLAVAVLIGADNWFSHLDWEKTQLDHTLMINMQIAETFSETTLGEYFEEHEEHLRSRTEDTHSLKHVFTGLESSDKTEIDMVASLYNINKNDIDAVIVLDADGRLIDIHPEIPEAIGKDFSGLPGFSYALAHHETYLSDVFHADTVRYLDPLFSEDENRYAVTLTHPAIIKEDIGGKSIERVLGTMSLFIKTGTLHRKFMHDLITPDREVWIMDKKGQIVCHPVSYHVGHHYYGIHKDNPDVIGLGEIVRSILSTGKDTMTSFTYHGEQPGSRIEKLISSHTVDIYGNRLTVGVTTPVESLAGPIRRDMIERIAVTLGIYIFFALFGFGFYRIQKRKGILEATVEANNALRESEGRFQNILETSPAGIVLVSDQGKIVDVNPAAKEMFGTSIEELVKMSFGDIRQGPSYVKGMEKGGHHSYSMEKKYSRKDGRIIWCDIVASAVRNENGELVRGISIVQDITDKKLAQEEKRTMERQLEQAQKAEALSILAGGISHDFNNILGIIVGNTELALMDVPVSNQGYSSLKAIKKTALQARDMVGQILTFSRQSYLPSGPIEIGPVIKESLAMLRSTLPATIEIREDISRPSDIINSDPTQLNQILLNLCTNAAHAMKEEGGILEVSLHSVTLDEDAASKLKDLIPGNYVKLTVSDTGTGIEPDVMERIFLPYFTTKEAGEGSGMGLSFIRGIVSNHKGMITVDSTPGKGTTFDVFFPSIEGHVEHDIEVSDALQRGDENLLFVDDVPEMVNSYRSALVRLGYEVSGRTSSIEALEAFKAQPDKYDLIITDQAMPHLTGQMMAKEMMAIRPDIPIIICAGHGDGLDEDTAKEMGIAAVIMKPIVMRDIAGTIRDVLSKDG